MSLGEVAEALWLRPKVADPVPALPLHDYGARFDIGAEKLIRPLAAEGGFVPADGRELNQRLPSRAVDLRVDDQPAQRWLPRSEAVLVSLDGRHRLHPHRGINGSVDWVLLESPR
ncbi:MAG: hypothetical protein ACK4F7_04215 [Inhella sp.]